MLPQALLVSSALASTTPPPPTYENLLVPSEYSTIQAAIDAAALHDTITISPGTYLENLHLRGVDITVRGAPGGERPLIDARRLGPGFYIENGESPATVIEHLRIANGKGDFFSRPWLPSNHRGGGGILIIESSSTIRDCVIHDCRHGGEGAGIATYRSSSLIQACEFYADSASWGGAVSFWESSGRIESCEFQHCEAEQGGGAISLFASTEVTIADCAFDSCQVPVPLWYPVWHGGAISVGDGQGTRIEHCRFSNCQAPNGGAIGCFESNDFSVRRCTFFRCSANGNFDGENHSDPFGGAIVALSTPVVEVIGNTFDRCLAYQWYNDDYAGGQAVYIYPAVFRNNIVIYSFSTSEAVIGPTDRAYNLYWRNKGGDFDGEPGEGEIFGDPRFYEDGRAQDYRLRPRSPAIDSGDPAQPLDPDQTRSDMGAIPYHHRARWEETEVPPTGLRYR